MISENMPKRQHAKLSYVNEGQVFGTNPIFLYIKDDKSCGLGMPGNSGYLINDGPGTLTVLNSDNGERFTKPMTVYIGEQLVWEHEDDILIHTLKLSVSGIGTNYRARFARGKNQQEAVE